MQISLLTFLTLVSSIAWALSISQVASEYRPFAVFASIAVFFVVVTTVALSSTSSNGQLDVDSNPIFRTLKPAINLALFAAVICSIGFVALILFVVYSIWTW